MTDQTGTRSRFLDLHFSELPLLLPNPWDLGSARLLTAMGFRALATTSGGFAGSLGRLDGSVTREEAIAHAAAIASSTGLPVNGDFENGFADEPAGVAETVRLAAAAGVEGCSIEDWSGSKIYDIEVATERVTAAAEAAHAASPPLVLTARAENQLRRHDNLHDTISRLRRYQEAGADVLYAPGLRTLEEVRAVVDSVDRPVNVLAAPGLPPVAELGEAGVSRVSVGSAFATDAYGAMIQAANEFRNAGTYGFLDRGANAYRELAREAFTGSGGS